MSVLVEEHNGVVIILDALGIKGGWKNNLAGILKEWKLLNQLLDKAPEDIDNAYGQSIEGFRDIEAIKDSFSDTLIITIRHLDNRIDAMLLLYAGAYLNSTLGFGIKHGLLFRGCMSVGKFYRGDRIVIGPAVDEAANYYELPNWIGASATPSTHLEITQLYYKEPKIGHNFVKYDIPLKGTTERNGWALNWVFHFVMENKEEETRQKIEKMIREKSTDIDVAFKLRNTLDFFNDMSDDT